MTVEKSIEELKQEATDIQVGTVESLNKMREEIQLWRDTDAARDARNNTIRAELEGEIEKLANLITVVRKREIPSIVKSPNHQRAELIQRAREFVEEQKYHAPGNITGRKGYSFKSNCCYFCDAKFIVNAKKRTVVCLLHDQMDELIITKGIAKCMPGGVFNEWIGKAIALAKALKIDIPQEFIDAVRPDEVVVGMKVEWTGSECHYPGFTKEIKPPGIYKNTGPECAIDSIFALNATILDDTNAEYEFGSVGE